MPTELILSVNQHLEEPPPARLNLASVLVSPYEQIRVVALCRSASQGAVEVVLTHIEGEAAVAPLDRYVLVPGAQTSRVYAVPGVILGVDAAPTADAPTDLDVMIWGFRVGEGYPAIQPLVPPKATATLVVHVFLDDGTGQRGASAGAGVEIRLDGVVIGTTDDTGSLTLGRTEGEYTVEAQAPSGATASVSTTITGGQTTDVDLVLSL